jgi:hypothetical protein
MLDSGRVRTVDSHDLSGLGTNVDSVADAEQLLVLILRARVVVASKILSTFTSHSWTSFVRLVAN